MSVLSTEALFAIMMAAECAVRGDFIASLKSKMSEAQYLELMLNIKHHPEEFIKAREEAEARFAKNSQHNAFLNLVRMSNSTDEKVSLRASLGILRMELSKKRQKLEQRKLKLRERIEDREARRAASIEQQEKPKEVVDTSPERQKVIQEKIAAQRADFAEFLDQVRAPSVRNEDVEKSGKRVSQSIAIRAPNVPDDRESATCHSIEKYRQTAGPPDTSQRIRCT